MNTRSRNVLVTGAARGIGAAIAEAFAAQGDWVAVTDLDFDAANAQAAKLGARSAAWQLDVRDAGSIETTFHEVASKRGDIHIVVANAGVSSMCRVVDLDEEQWDLNMDVNAKGVFLLNRAAVRHFMDRNIQGRIVNVASMAGKIGAPLLAHYSASKFAVVGFTQALAHEVGAHGITVNAVCPGFVRTSMQEREVAWEAEARGMTPSEVLDDYVSQVPLRRLEEPTDVANAVTFLASDAASYITGESLNVTGGARMD